MGYPEDFRSDIPSDIRSGYPPNTGPFLYLVTAQHWYIHHQHEAVALRLISVTTKPGAHFISFFQFLNDDDGCMYDGCISASRNPRAKIGSYASETKEMVQWF
jgi:hypothetical protein